MRKTTIKTITLSVGIFFAGISLVSCMAESKREQCSHLSKVLSDINLKNELAKFADNILRQVPSKSFFYLVDIIDWQSASSDQEIYTRLLAGTPEILPNFQVVHKLAALRHQKAILGEQIVSLLGTSTVLDGCVEIGSPATYISAIQNRVSCTGDIYAITDGEHVTDRLQALSFRPLNGFVPHNKSLLLNSYEPISELDIPSNSVDCVICLIGLHHIPVEKLDGYVASIHRILRPGGAFILRDHDAYNDDMASLVWSAHAIFNAIMSQVSVEDEVAEYRNFQPLNYWIQLLENHGFAVGAERLLQEGDPTLNTLLQFKKIAVTADDKLHDFSRTIQKNNADYKRDISQTYLTTPEWVNVDVSQEYGNFINHTPFYEFPYMQSLSSYWKTFAASWKSAAQRSGHLHVLTSPYTLMNTFIGLTMTVEYTAKSLLSLPVRMMFSGEEAGVIKMIVHDPLGELAGLGDRITILQEDAVTGFKLVELTRYKEFLQTLMLLKNSSVVIKEIAGQPEVQVKVKGSKQLAPIDIPGCSVEYSWTLPTAPDLLYYALSIKTDKLLEAILYLESCGYTIMYVHDF